MSKGEVQRARMLARLERYATLRADGMRPVEAAAELDVSIMGAGVKYERWYRRERLHMPDRERVLPESRRTLPSEPFNFPAGRRLP